MTSENRSQASTPSPDAVRVARVLLWIESVAWMLIGILLVMGGLIVLSGGSGLAGVVSDPVGDPRIGGWVVGTGIVIGVIAIWGVGTVWAMRRQTRAPYTSALLFSGVWIVLGIFWIVIGSTPIPGVLTIAVNLVILFGARGAAVVSIGISWDPLTPNKARRRLKHLQRDEVDATIRLGLPARGGDGGSPWRNSCTPGPGEPPQVALRRSRSACAVDGDLGPLRRTSAPPMIEPACYPAALLPSRTRAFMKEATVEMFEKLLVATDGSSSSDAAIDAASGLAAKIGCEVEVVHVHEHEFVPSKSGISPDLETPDEASAVVATAIEKLRLNGVVAHGHVVQAPTREVARKVIESRTRPELI